MKHAASIVLALVAAPLLAGCGSGKQWAGPPRPSADGTVSVTGFTDFRRAPIDTAAAFLRLDERQAATTSLVSKTNAEGGDQATVTATFGGLLDDSINAQQYVLLLERQADGTWLLRSATFSQRCQPGRGHQDFSPAPCV